MSRVTEKQVSNEELLQLPDLESTMDVEELCQLARDAEDAKDWDRAETLWEYAMFSEPIDMHGRQILSEDEGKEIWEEDYASIGYGAVIVPHLHQILKNHFSLPKINIINNDPEKIKPVGFCKKKMDQLENYNEVMNHAHFRSSKSLTIEFLIMALCALIAILLPYPLPEWMMIATSIEMFAVIIAVTFVGGSLFSFWGGVITFCIMYFLVTNAGAMVSDAIGLENEGLGENYFIRGFHGLIAVILLINMILARRKIKKSVQQSIEARRKYTPCAEQLYAHLYKCSEACRGWFQLDHSDMKEVFAIRLKYLYVRFDQDHPFFGFKQITGMPKEDGWSDALDVTLNMEEMYYYYHEMCEKSKQYLKQSQKYQDVYQEYIKRKKQRQAQK